MALEAFLHYNARHSLQQNTTMLNRCLYILLLSGLINPIHAQSDANKPVTTVSLAPHITELIYVAGGGETLVGVSAYSNYPKQAVNLTVVGDAFRIDLEQMIALQPDMIFYWQGTTTNQVLQQLQQHNLNTIPIKIDSLADIGEAIKDIAKHIGLKQPDAYQQFKKQLHSHKQQQSTIRSVFIQLSEQPLYTVSADHWMSEAAALCGLENIFQQLPTIAATVTKEAVIVKNPDVIIRMQPLNKNSPLKQWPQISAIKNNHIAVLNPDTFSRPTPRILNAIEDLCQQVNQFSGNASAAEIN
ncbi:helical backbone metal receptor [Marinicella gelatinilytica]|uniref:helical backbone metal receptor n=1 Tax=Marinicella gelatinilytica TaxID=2996017 RepID=UPI002260D3A6|nr:helical backbone metal receptor [Marinicella gelatinilytica]MCX7545235.1 helical backbone metal receptor [Marinicella gelatinilytica]